MNKWNWNIKHLFIFMFLSENQYNILFKFSKLKSLVTITKAWFLFPTTSNNLLTAFDKTMGFCYHIARVHVQYSNQLYWIFKLFDLKCVGGRSLQDQEGY